MSEAGVEERHVRERWVAEDDVVGAGDRLLQESEDVRGPDLGPVVEARGGDVLPQRLERLGRTLDERRVCRAAGQRLDAEGARSGEEIEHARLIEDRLE